MGTDKMEKGLGKRIIPNLKCRQDIQVEILACWEPSELSSHVEGLQIQWPGYNQQQGLTPIAEWRLHLSFSGASAAERMAHLP